MKICSKCKIKKTEDGFYRNKNEKDGFSYQCKDCAKKYSQSPAGIACGKRYWKKLRKTDEYHARLVRQREYGVSTKGKASAKKYGQSEKGKELRKKRRMENMEKYRARYKIKNAIEYGQLKRLPCVVCKNPKSEGHHPDYSKPLDVIFLCLKHHRELHHPYLMERLR